MINLSFLTSNIKRNKHLLINFIALGAVQLTNFIVPIISFPYLIKAIGINKFGVVSYGLTIMMYFTTFTDYGFNLTSTREISLNQNNKKKLSIIFSNVLATKILLFVISCLFLLLVIFSIERFERDSAFYLIGLFYIFSNTIMPTWYFQGVERMKHITIANLISKILLILFIIVFIKEPEDYIYILGIYGMANFTSGLYGIYIAYKKDKLKIERPTWSCIIKNLKEGWGMLISNLSIIGFSNMNIIILGFYVSDGIIGSYSVSEKVVFALWQILSIYSQATFPYVCKLYQAEHNRIRKYLTFVYMPFNIFIMCVCIVTYLYANYVVKWLVGESDLLSIHLLKIMCGVIYIVCFNIPAYQILLANNYRKYYSSIFNIATIINILLCPLLVKIYGVEGAVFSLLLVQLFVTISLNLIIEIKLKTLSIWRTY